MLHLPTRRFLLLAMASSSGSFAPAFARNALVDDAGCSLQLPSEIGPAP